MGLEKLQLMIFGYLFEEMIYLLFPLSLLDFLRKYLETK